MARRRADPNAVIWLELMCRGGDPTIGASLAPKVGPIGLSPKSVCLSASRFPHPIPLGVSLGPGPTFSLCSPLVRSYLSISPLVHGCCSVLGIHCSLWWGVWPFPFAHACSTFLQLAEDIAGQSKDYKGILIKCKIRIQNRYGVQLPLCPSFIPNFPHSAFWLGSTRSQHYHPGFPTLCSRFGLVFSPTLYLPTPSIFRSGDPLLRALRPLLQQVGYPSDCPDLVAHYSRTQ